MSQLFTRLAQRATLTAPVLERRARALFEPVGQTAPVALQTIETDAAAEPATATAHTQAHADAQPQTVQRSAPRAPLETRRDPERLIETPPPLKPARRAATPPAAAEPEPTPRPVAIPTPQVGRSQLAALPPSIEEPRRRHTPQVTPTAERLTLTERHVEIARTVREAVTEATALQPPREPRPAPITAPSTRPEAVLQPRTRPTPSAQLARARAEAPPAAAPASAPVVQFSIGRVEVRAPASGPEKRASSRATGPKLSLEAYLDGRRRGGR